MPIKIPDGLPAGERLAEENIFAMQQTRAVTQDIRPLKIGILNLMPAKEVTELQLLRLLSNTALQVDVTLLRTASYDSKHVEPSHLDSFYRTFDEVKADPFDGLIITGAPVERLPFSGVLYWEELVNIMEWADRNVFSTFYICWAAQAALYHFYGIDKEMLPEKVFGVFEHTVCDPHHKLVRGFDERFYIPHSRHSNIREADVLSEPALELISTSPEAGVYLCADRSGRRVYAMGHGEYDVDTLRREYERDVKAGMDIKPPKNYFPGDDPKKPPIVSWRAHGNLLMANWLNYFVYQETPYELSAIALSKDR